MTVISRFQTAAAILALCLFTGCAHLPSAPSPLQVTHSEWQGEIRQGEPCVIAESDHLRVTILKRGAWIVSVVDTQSGEEFINMGTYRAHTYSGIYDRMTTDGAHNWRLRDPKHLVNQPYNLSHDATSLTFSYDGDDMSVVRQLTFASDAPKFRIDATYTAKGDQPRHIQPVLFSQMNLSNTKMIYDQVAILPGPDGWRRVLTHEQDVWVDQPTAGWWGAVARDSKKAVLMRYPTDGRIRQTYQYRIASGYHFIPLLHDQMCGLGEKRTLWQDYHFVSDRKAMQKACAFLPKSSQRELMREFDNEPRNFVTRRPPRLPKLAAGTSITPVPASAKARVAYLRAAVFDNPEVVERRSWFSVDKLLLAAAELAASDVSLIIVSGASSHGLEREMALTRAIMTLTGKETVYVPNKHDAKNITDFEAQLNTRNWSRTIADVQFIAFAPGEERWLEQELARHKQRRTVIIGRQFPTQLAAKYPATLGLFGNSRWQYLPVFSRQQQWTVLKLPLVMDHTRYMRDDMAIIDIYDDTLDVAIKPIGESFGPHLILDAKGLCPRRTARVKPETNKPRLTVVQLGHTEITATPKKDAEKVAHKNLQSAIAQINKLKPDLVFHCGNIVKEADASADWQLYNTLRKDLNVPIYHLPGQLDRDTRTWDGKNVFTAFRHHLEQEPTFVLDKKGIQFIGVTPRTTTPDRLATIKTDGNTICRVMLSSPGIWTSRRVPEWSDALKASALTLTPTVNLAGYEHSHQKWHVKRGLHEIVTTPLAMPKGHANDPGWVGYLIHDFYDDHVTTSFKRLDTDDLYFTTDLPYQKP